MTKKYEFDWIIPVPPELTTGCVFDRWFENEKETKENDFERDALFKVDEYGFFLYWKSEGRVIYSININIHNIFFNIL